MSQWPLRPLGEFLAPKRGSVNPANYPNERFNLFSIPAYDSGKFDSVLGMEIGSSKPIVKAGDAMVSRIVPHIRRAWVVDGCANNRLLASSEWLVFRHPDVLPHYLKYFFLSDTFHGQFMRTVAGVGGSLVRAKASGASRIQIPVPPLAEQERIVRMLDEADAIRKLRAQADQRTADLIPALFHDMFGDPKNNPMGWPDRSLRELSDRLSDGPFGSNLKSSHYMNSGVRVIRLQNIGVGQFIDSDAAFISQKHFDQLRKHSCFPGDVIVGTLGNPNRRACVLSPEIPIALNKADCVQIRPNREIANADFICSLLNLPSTLEMVSGMILGQTRSRISMGRLAALVVPVPPLPLQQEFATRVAEVRCIQEHQMTSGSAGQATFEAILDGVFSTKD